MQPRRAATGARRENGDTVHTQRSRGDVSSFVFELNREDGGVAIGLR